MTWSEIAPDTSRASSCISRAKGEWNTAHAWNDWPYFTI